VTVRVIDYRLDGVPGAEPLYRLATKPLDATKAPAAEVAALYHERWEAETIFAEVKVTLPGERLMLRSRRADLAEREVFGLPLANFALRRLMVRASAAVDGAPDELSFPHTVSVAADAITREWSSAR
jgi:Transposase DDE domain